MKIIIKTETITIVLVIVYQHLISRQGGGPKSPGFEAVTKWKQNSYSCVSRFVTIYLRRWIRNKQLQVTVRNQNCSFCCTIGASQLKNATCSKC